MDTAAVLQNHSFTHQYRGELLGDKAFIFNSELGPQVIGYWSLTVVVSLLAQGSEELTTSFDLSLASRRAPGQGRSTFGEHYYSEASSSRKSLSLVPQEILGAITTVTGVVFPTSNDIPTNANEKA